LAKVGTPSTALHSGCQCSTPCPPRPTQSAGKCFRNNRHEVEDERLCCLHHCSDCYRAERSNSRAGLSSRCGPAPFTAHCNGLISTVTPRRSSRRRPPRARVILLRLRLSHLRCTLRSLAAEALPLLATRYGLESYRRITPLSLSVRWHLVNGYPNEVLMVTRTRYDAEHA
jgi:hypothetical protein